MALDDLLKEKTDRLESVPDRLVERIQSAERSLLAQINILLGEFDRDQNGNLLANVNNLTRLQALKPRLEELFVGSEYVEAVREFAQEFDKQTGLNKEYYDALMDYVESSELTAMTQLNKQQAVGLLMEGAIDANFFDPIVGVMTESVNTNASFVETVQAIKIITQGGEVDGSVVLGRLSRYAKQIAYDSMAISDRTYNQQVAKEMDIQFYRYTGGTINDTRDFCSQRNGRVWHKNEIEQWSGLQWQGKHRATSSGTIFVLLGGYNCRHSLIPTPLSLVPLEDLQRNLTNGNLTLSDRERQILGL